MLYPELYKSSSAFAPILNPTQCPWGKKAFSGPNGDDGYLKGGVEEGKGRDATELLKSLDKTRQLDIFIDYVRIVSLLLREFSLTKTDRVLVITSTRTDSCCLRTLMLSSKKRATRTSLFARKKVRGSSPHQTCLMEGRCCVQASTTAIGLFRL